MHSTVYKVDEGGSSPQILILQGDRRGRSDSPEDHQAQRSRLPPARRARRQPRPFPGPAPQTRTRVLTPVLRRPKTALGTARGSPGRDLAAPPPAVRSDRAKDGPPVCSRSPGAGSAHPGRPLPAEGAEKLASAPASAPAGHAPSPLDPGSCAEPRPASQRALAHLRPRRSSGRHGNWPALATRPRAWGAQRERGGGCAV